MRCIIYHNETTPPKILAIRTRCRKGLITYHKFNGITTMKKYVESYHSTLVEKLLEDPTNLATRSSFNCEPNKKKVQVSPSATFGFFSFANKFKKDDAIQVVLLENLMLFVIKGLMFTRTIE
jgi:hypothetical protein